MEPREYERESKKVAQLIVYAYTQLGLAIDPIVAKAAKDYYGDEKRVHVFTEVLCSLCSAMPDGMADRIIYDGSSKDARRLAGWWDAHQEADAKKSKEAARKKRTAATKASAMAKLSPKEKKALGLK